MLARRCQNWSEQNPNEHDRTPENFVGQGLGDHNFCRNPDFEHQPWCYVTTERRWDYCDPFNICSDTDTDSHTFEQPVPFFLERASLYESENEVFATMTKVRARSERRADWRSNAYPPSLQLNGVPKSHLEHEPYPSYGLPDGLLHIDELLNEDGHLRLSYTIAVNDQHYAMYMVRAEGNIYIMGCALLTLSPAQRPNSFNRLDFIRYDVSSLSEIKDDFNSRMKAVCLVNLGLINGLKEDAPPPLPSPAADREETVMEMCVDSRASEASKRKKS